MVKSFILPTLLAFLGPHGAHTRKVSPLECSCSPKSFQFVISLDLDPICTNNDIVDNTGIAVATTACFVEAGIPPDRPLIEGSKEEMIPEELTNPDFEVMNITSFIYKEFDQDGDIISETKQNYGNSPLEDGTSVNVFSVSSTLNPSLPLEDQMGRVPSSVEIRVFGFNAEEQMISNIIRWTYDMSCGSFPIQTGDTIGWITIVSIVTTLKVCVFFHLQPLCNASN